jgi:O-antigen/teichoic acid export membrane protein
MLVRHLSRGAGIEGGIWSPFRSLLGAQVIGAALGLVFWVLAARLVDAREVGVAAAAISAQTLLGLVTVLGVGTLLISELPQHAGARQRQLVFRGLLVVTVPSLLLGALMVGLSPVFTVNLREALSDPVGATAFALGVAAAAWAVVVDEASLGVKRSAVQVQRNLLASSLRFPVTAVLLTLGLTDARVLQLCWVIPLVVSVPFAFWRLRLPRRPRGGDRGPSLRSDVAGLGGHALRNHALTLSLSAASQLVPVVAGITLTSVDNAEFAIAWLMASFAFLPPYLLAIALFAHGANVSTEEFRASMSKTLPASLLLSATLVVGAWVLGEPVLLIFGGDYATESWLILALLVPAGLWMCVKDHLVAMYRSQRRFATATRLSVVAVFLELTGALVGALLWGPVGLCLGWLAAMVVESVLAIPWLREAFGGLRWQAPIPLRDRAEHGRAAPQVVGAAAIALLVVGVGVWTATRGNGGEGPVTSPTGSATVSSTPSPTEAVEDCLAEGATPPKVDLDVQAATGDRRRPLRPPAEVARLVGLAKDAGAEVISTTASFRTMQPIPGGEFRFQGIDLVLDAAVAEGLQVRIKLMGMPAWALDEPNGTRRQPPRTEAELERWAGFVDVLLRHVDRRVGAALDYVEIWNEPNSQKFWTTGPDPVEFARLLETTTSVVRQVAPTVSVISGGLVGNDLGFLTRLYEAFDTIGLTETPFDALGLHPFAGAAAPSEVDPARVFEREPYGLYDGNYTGFEGMKEIMAEAGDADLPVYLTQFGYTTRPQGTIDAVTDETRADYLDDAFALATCAGYVSGLAWYALHPTPWDPASWTLVDGELRPNQTYAALVAWSQRTGAAGPSGDAG